jgi:hypothetical protein
MPQDRTVDNVASNGLAKRRNFLQACFNNKGMLSRNLATGLARKDKKT